MSQFYKKPDKEPAPQKGTGGRKPGRKKSWFFPEITGKKRIALYAYSALTVLAAIIVVGYIAFEAFSAPPPIPSSSINTRPPRPSADAAADPNGPEFVQNPELSSDRKDQFYTFLLVGQDIVGGGLTDTMMLAAYDVPNQTLNVMSLPRDTYVRRNGSLILLNAVYVWVGGGDAGKEALKAEVTKLTGIPVDYFAVVQWKAFGELVDAIGGVYYDVPRNMNYKDPEQNLYINVKKGYQLLDGDLAMQVVRFREGANGYADGDLGRIRTQQGFMKAVVKKCLEPGVLLSNLTEYIEIFQKNVNTDLTAGDLTYFAKSAVGGLEMDNVAFVTMPNKPASNGHLYPDAPEIVKLVNEGFNPYREDIELWELTVESGSSGGGSGSGSSTTSTPKPSATPTPSPSGSPEPTDSPEPTGSSEPSHSPSPSDSPRPNSSARPSASPRPSEGPVMPTGSEASPEVSPSATDEPDPEESGPPAQETDTPIFTPPPMATPEPTPVPSPEEAPPLIPSGPVG